MSSESGRRDEAQQKVIENLEEGLNNHDKGVMNLFNVEVAPLLAWTEELLAIRAYLTGEDYVAGSFTNELRNIYKNSFVLLDTNLDSDVSSSYASSSHAHPLQYYVNLEDEWEFLYLDDLNIIEELLTILPDSPYTCDVLYYAASINKAMKDACVHSFKEQCQALYDTVL